MITQWFETTVDFLDLFWAFTKFRWPFWDITQFRWPFLGISLNFIHLFGASVKCLDSNQLMTQVVSRRLESIQFMAQASFHELTQNQLMTPVASPGRYWFWLTRDLKCFPIFRFESTHDSSEKHLILSRLMILFWFIPVLAFSDVQVLLAPQITCSLSPARRALIYLRSPLLRRCPRTRLLHC